MTTATEALNNASSLEDSRETPKDSLKKRYFFKVFSNVIGLVSNVLVQAIVPRALGPKAYGSFNFLTHFFEQTFEMIDGRSSVGALVKVSLRPKETGLVVTYFYYAMSVSLAILGLVYGFVGLGWQDIIWPEQETKFIYFAALWGLLVWQHGILHKLCDAYGLTVEAEKVRIVQKILSMALIVSLFVSNRITLNTFFIYYIGILSFLYIGFGTILLRAGVWPKFKEWFIPFTKIHQYIKEYYVYALPLFIYIAMEAVVAVFDRWLLQKFSGSVEQGYFGFAFQIGYVSILFVTAMSPLIQREFSVAFAEKNYPHMAYLYRRYMPMLFSVAAFFSCFVFFQADKLIYLFAGQKYEDSLTAITIMAFYPVFYNFGRITSSIFFATGKTKLFRNIGVTVFVLGIFLSWFLMAPSKYFGLGLGATGLAIKLVLIYALLVNIQLYINTRILKIGAREYFLHEILAIVGFLFLGWMSTILVDKLFFAGVDSTLVQFLAGGVFYVGLVAAMTYVYPGLLGIYHSDILYLLRKVKLVKEEDEELSNWKCPDLEISDQLKERKDFGLKKRMVFHFLHPMDQTGDGASRLRPQKMLQAFKDIGYEVEIVAGTAEDRVRKIKEIKHNVSQGIRYDFLYSESSTSPTLLTGTSKIPLYPFDFSFMSWFKENCGKVGLFYRDMYWAFPQYKEHLGPIKSFIGRCLHKYDLYRYKKVLDHLYLPSERMKKYLPELVQKVPTTTLPAGFDEALLAEKIKYLNEDEPLKVAYVGGVKPPYYDISAVFRSVENSKVDLHVICRGYEWHEVKEHYHQPQIQDNVHIHHAFGDKAQEIIKNCEVGILFREQNDYVKFMMPYKVFEYLGHHLPIIARKDTAVGDFIEQTEFGWVVNSEGELKALLEKLSRHKYRIEAKMKLIKEHLGDMTWLSRSQEVANQLKNPRRPEGKLHLGLLAARSSIHTIKWANSLAERGHKVSLFSLHNEGDDELHNDVDLYRLHFKPPLGYFLNIFKLRKYLKEIKPDILHVHYVSGYGSLGSFSGYRPRVMSVWGSDIYNFPYLSLANKTLIKQNLVHADWICSTSYVMAQQTLGINGKVADRMSVTPFGIDLETFINRRIEDSSEVVIGTVKTLDTRYGIDLLIKAFSIVYKKVQSEEQEAAKPLKLMIVGGGPQREVLQDLADSLGVGHCTEFVGQIRHELVPEYLNKLDVYVAMSRAESFGVAVIEASACEKPVIVSDVGGLPEVVKDGETGYIVEIEDVKTLADRMYELVKSKELRTKFGQAGRKLASERYNWDYNVSQMEWVYRHILFNLENKTRWQ